jgi:hypothetical protein
VKTKGDSNIPSIPIPVAQAAPHPLPIFVEPMPYNGPAYNARREVNYIPDDESIANVFCFGAFADKVSGVVYNDLTGNFHSCRLMEVCVSSYCTITKLTQYW